MRQFGFTLVETLICIAVSAVLLGLAVPSYRHSLLKARRQEARLELERVQVLQERHYFDRARYADTLAALDLPSSMAGRFYELAMVVAPDGQAYRLEARAIGDQVDDVECRMLSLDESHARAASGGDPCWR